MNELDPTGLALALCVAIIVILAYSSHSSNNKRSGVVFGREEHRVDFSGCTIIGMIIGIPIGIWVLVALTNLGLLGNQLESCNI